MRLTLKTWIGNSDDIQTKSLFALVFPESPDLLQTTLASGHEGIFRTKDESKLKLAKEANKTISKHDYNFVGTGVPISELISG